MRYGDTKSMDASFTCPSRVLSLNTRPTIAPKPHSTLQESIKMAKYPKSKIIND